MASDADKDLLIIPELTMRLVNEPLDEAIAWISKRTASQDHGEPVRRRLVHEIGTKEHQEAANVANKRTEEETKRHHGAVVFQ